MTFFFDNNLSPRLVEILRLLDVDAKHQRDLFASDPGDISMIGAVGDRGWVLITCDRHIRTRAAERAALREHGVTSVFFVERFLKRTLWDQALWLLKYWRDLERLVGSAQPGTQFRALGQGRIERLASNQP